MPQLLHKGLYTVETIGDRIAILEWNIYAVMGRLMVHKWVLLANLHRTYYKVIYINITHL